MGPTGIYVAAKSKTITIRGDFFLALGGVGPNEKDKLHLAAYQNLVAQLTQDGWEPTGIKQNPRNWWSDIFQRTAR